MIHQFSCVKLISKAFTLFCRGFENVVNHEYLVLIVWAKSAVGGILFAFCNNAGYLFLCYFSEVPLAFRCSQSNKPVVKELLLSFSQIVIAK